MEAKGKYFEGRHVNIAPSDSEQDSEDENDIQFDQQEEEEGATESDF